VQLKGLRQLKKINLIGSRTRDPPDRSIVPQPTTVSRVPVLSLGVRIILNWNLKYDVRISVKTAFSGGVLRTRQWAFGISWLTERLSATQEGLFSVRDGGLYRSFRLSEKGHLAS
jgi:hypothetical protein